MKGRMTVITLALGNRTIYAPNTPAMAPLAPMLGISDPGNTAVCVRAATVPAAR